MAGAAGQWLVETAYAAETITGLLAAGVEVAELSRHATRLREFLAPHANRLVITGIAVTLKGCVAHYLGLLAAAQGDQAAAETYLRQAVTVHERLGAVSLALASRLALRRISGADDDAATEAYERGLVGLVPNAALPTLVRDGPMWIVSSAAACSIEGAHS